MGLVKNAMPQLFEVVSDNCYLLGAMGFELKKLGYEVCHLNQCNDNDVLHFDTDYNDSRMEELESFKRLDIHQKHYSETLKRDGDIDVNVVTFTLPKQWDEAIAFAKKQLKLKYWKDKKSFEINGYKVTVDFKKEELRADDYIMSFEELAFLVNFESEYTKKFEDSSSTMMFKIGCQMVKISELKQLNDYVLLNTKKVE